jgi:hypothetical protein
MWVQLKLPAGDSPSSAAKGSRLEARLALLDVPVTDPNVAPVLEPEHAPEMASGKPALLRFEEAVFPWARSETCPSIRAAMPTSDVR